MYVQGKHPSTLPANALCSTELPVSAANRKTTSYLARPTHEPKITSTRLINRTNFSKISKRQRGSNTDVEKAVRSPQEKETSPGVADCKLLTSQGLYLCYTEHKTDGVDPQTALSFLPHACIVILIYGVSYTENRLS